MKLEIRDYQVPITARMPWRSLVDATLQLLIMSHQETISFKCIFRWMKASWFESHSVSRLDRELTRDTTKGQTQSLLNSIKREATKHDGLVYSHLRHLLPLIIHMIYRSISPLRRNDHDLGPVLNVLQDPSDSFCQQDMSRNDIQSPPNGHVDPLQQHGKKQRLSSKGCQKCLHIAGSHIGSMHLESWLPVN